MSDHAGKIHKANGTPHCITSPLLELVCQLCCLLERRENKVPYL